MAIAIVQAGFTLHVWARRPATLAVLADVPQVVHDTSPTSARPARWAASACAPTRTCGASWTVGPLANLRPGSVVVNLPYAEHAWHRAAELPERTIRACTEHEVPVLDARESGAHTSTTMIGGDESIAAWCTPVFRSYSSYVRYQGPAGSGQLANHAAIEEVVAVADGLGVDAPAPVELLKVGGAASFTLRALNDAITVPNANHLREVELLDMQLFALAMAERDANADAVTGRGVSGTEGLVSLIQRVNPG